MFRLHNIVTVMDDQALKTTYLSIYISGQRLRFTSPFKENASVVQGRSLGGGWGGEERGGVGGRETGRGRKVSIFHTVTAFTTKLHFGE